MVDVPDAEIDVSCLMTRVLNRTLAPSSHLFALAQSVAAINAWVASNESSRLGHVEPTEGAADACPGLPAEREATRKGRKRHPTTV
ncbi:MAG: hypothetical protein JWQ19_3844 [Subtercola sp.]|nr:hypothetical protein [Subtercola sp.]